MPQIVVAEARREALNLTAGFSHVEPGAAVIGIDQADAVALGAEFGQEAIFVLTPVDRRVVGCTDKRAVTTGRSAEPDTGAAGRSLAVSRFSQSHIGMTGLARPRPTANRQCWPRCLGFEFREPGQDGWCQPVGIQTVLGPAVL